jgi:hypothetical protein
MKRRGDSEKADIVGKSMMQDVSALEPMFQVMIFWGGEVPKRS